MHSSYSNIENQKTGTFCFYTSDRTDSLGLTTALSQPLPTANQHHPPEHDDLDSTADLFVEASPDHDLLHCALVIEIIRNL